MWETDEGISLPRTKKPFFLSSHKGDIMLIKEGKAFVLSETTWSPIRTVAFLNGKILSVHPSQSHSISIHLPKLTPLLAIHENRKSSLCLTVPIPFNYLPENQSYSNLDMVLTPECEHLLVSMSHQRIGDVPYLFGKRNKKFSDFASLIKDFAVNDDGRIIAVLLEDALWVWNQLPDQVRGDGWWTNVAVDDAFQFRKWESADNRPLAFQSLCVFRNPDELSGVCLLSCLLPPYKPFKEMYVFNHMCTFNNREKIFEHYSITIPILTGNQRPEIFWSPCGRMFIMCVNSSVLLLTRYLKIVSSTPLSEVFQGDGAYLSSVAWSANGQYCVLTSTVGSVGVITRGGESMLHCVCDLTPFDNRYIEMPLKVCADTRDPTSFIVYSNTKMRKLRIDMSLISQSIDNLMSIPYPTKSGGRLMNPTMKLIQSLDLANPYDLTKLLYYTELYHIFELDSPLRYIVWTTINDSLHTMVKLGKHHALCYFLARHALRVCDKESPAYLMIMDQLKYATNKRDMLMLRVLEDELHRRDWQYLPREVNDRITLYETTIQDNEQMKTHKRAADQEDVDLEVVSQYIQDILYNPDFMDVDEVPVDLALLLELMIELGRFDRAMLIARHESIVTDPVHLFLRIIGLHPSDPIAILQAMEICVTASPVNEPEIRAIAVKAILNIMKQIISDTAPTANNTKTPFISSLCMLEESVEIPIPENIEQTKDFAVICGFALCAADYVNVSNFLNGKSKLIANSLRAAVREIFLILWFVRWRHAAMRETKVLGCPGDATLRLLPYPEFIDQVAAREAIRAIGRNGFTPELYDHYMTGNADFEHDPEFLDYVCQCAVRITPRVLSRIQILASSFVEKMEADVPESRLLQAVIVSHVVPWLRGGIPRAIVKFPAPEIIPNSLLDWEDWKLPQKPSPMIIATQPTEEIVEPVQYAEVTEEEEPHETAPEPQMDTTQLVKTLPDSVPVPDPDRELSEGEELPLSEREKEVSSSSSSHKAKSKSRHRHLSSDQSSEEPKEEKRRRLKLINVDRSRKNFVPAPMPVPVQSQFQPGYGFNPVGPHPPPVAIFQQVHAPIPTASYGPIWDLDPGLYERPYPRAPPNIPLEPHASGIRASTETQCLGGRMTIEVNTKKKASDSLDISSSGLGEMDFTEQEHRYPPVDPFPLDEELRRRVDRLLAEEIQVNATRLPPAPKFIRKTFTVTTEHSIDSESRLQEAK